jgi:hypothetical protein
MVPNHSFITLNFKIQQVIFFPFKRKNCNFLAKYLIFWNLKFHIFTLFLTFSKFLLKFCNFITNKI